MTKKLDLGRVMLIDDDLVDQMLYRRVLSRHGEAESIETFECAPEALERLRDPSLPLPQVIFLDINMPRMSGFEFLDTAVLEMGLFLDQIAVVMLTTSVDPADRQRARAYSAVRAFIHKPLRPEHLHQVYPLSRIQSALTV